MIQGKRGKRADERKNRDEWQRERDKGIELDRWGWRIVTIYWHFITPMTQTNDLVTFTYDLNETIELH